MEMSGNNSRNNNNKWKFRMTEWRGYVIRTLEELTSDIHEIKKTGNKLTKHVNEEVSIINKRLRKLESETVETKTERKIYKSFGMFILGGTATAGFAVLAEFLKGLI